MAKGKIGQFDDAIGLLQAALHAADDCAAAGPDKGGNKQGDDAAAASAALTESERHSSYGMLAELLAEWGHIAGAHDACERGRAILPGSACKAEQRVVCDTTKGEFELSIFRLAAPIGADRFIDLIWKSVYNESAFHRVTDHVAQWGFAATAKQQAQNARTYPKLEDDINLNSNVERGTLTFHGHGQNSRHTAVFIAKKFYPQFVLFDDPKRRYENDWHRAFGRVTRGMDVIESIFVTGDMERPGVDPSVKQGPNMLQVQLMGNKYLEQEFPGFDKIKYCKVIQTSL